MSVFVIVLLSVVLVSSPITSAVDFGLVRIMVDEDSVRLLIDGDVVELDAYGNRLTRNAWFIVNLPVGVHTIELDLSGFDPITKTATVTVEEVASFEVNFRPPDAPVTIPIMLSSDPDSAEIFLDGDKLALLTPAVVPVDSGTHRIEIQKAGYEALARNMSVGPGQKGSANFILRSLPPEPVTMESLGLQYEAVLPILPIESVDRLWDSYQGFSEAFAIVPFGQGVLAKILGSGDTDSEANLLIAIGAGLSIGAYVIGKVHTNHKRKIIIERNASIAVANDEAKVHNRDIDNTVRSENRAIKDNWQRAGKNRGKVSVSIE